MQTYSKCFIIGRLTADPELRQTNTGKSVTRITLAVDRRVAKESEKIADFIDVSTWDSKADVIARYCKKGSPLCVTGSIRTGSYTDKNGTKHKTTEVLADEVILLDVRDSGASAPASPSASAPVAAPHFEDVTNMDNLPF